MKTFSLFIISISLLAADEKKPNILFLLTDEQSWGDYSFMGHPQIETPAIDKLAASGLTFQRGYRPVPLFRPSLASIITGLHPHEHGVTGNAPALSDESLNAEEERANPAYPSLCIDITKEWKTHPNWMRSLKASGYRSLQTGKWREGRAVEDSDFTEDITFGTPDKGSHLGDARLDIGHKALLPIKDFITQSGDQPWFISYSIFLPRHPHNPPQELLDKYLKKTDNPDIAAYWASCERLDNTIANLMGFLEETGELENTLVIFTCNNGWTQNPEQLKSLASRSTLTVYEGSVRTPIIFSWKDKIIPRMDTQNLATYLDIWPTAAALCETPLPEGLRGINLTNFAQVETREIIFGSDYAQNIAQHGAPLQSLENRFAIEGDWKIIAPNPLLRDTKTKPQLYNLSRDPHEKKDLAADNPQRVQAMVKKLNAWWSPSQ